MGAQEMVGLTNNQHNFAQHLAALWGELEVAAESRDFPSDEGAASHSGSSSKYVAKAGLLHGYHISQSRHWKPWRARVAGPVQHWWCRSLSEAFFHYSWPEAPQPNSFQCIAARLRQALAVKDQAAARHECLAIFKWGGVARKANDKSRVWVEDQYQKKTLCQSIMQATQLLQPGSSQALDAFDGRRLLMNAAMTKVYAAADPDNIIIYDGRVGAALGLLARYWLEMCNIADVPADLAFRWGRGQGNAKRDPSLGNYSFPELYSPSTKTHHKDAAWAGQVRLAGQLLKRVMVFNSSIASIGDVEKALFMIGFSVEPELPPQPLPKCCKDLNCDGGSERQYRPEPAADRRKCPL